MGVNGAARSYNISKTIPVEKHKCYQEIPPIEKLKLTLEKRADLHTSYKLDISASSIIQIYMAYITLQG